MLCGLLLADRSAHAHCNKPGDASAVTWKVIYVNSSVTLTQGSQEQLFGSTQISIV